MDERQTEAGVVADLAARAAEPKVVNVGGVDYLITPDGSSVRELGHGLLADAPSRISQLVTLQTVDSLGDYVNRFKGEDTTLFADIAANAIKAAIDYHGANAPGHVDHIATLTLPFSVEWQTWAKIDGKMMPQLEFARFIEENAADVVAPLGADLLEICRDLQAVRRADFKRVVRTSGMDERFEYTEGTDATAKNGTIEVPTRFKLEVPVYFGERAVTLFANLRWVLGDGGQLHLGVQLHRPEHVRQAVFKEIVLEISARTGAQALFGKL